MPKKLYNDKSIESVDARTHVRMRPGMYIGSTEDSSHLMTEAFANAVDEAATGNTDLIEITINNDHFSVRDYGQGILPSVVREEDNKTILEAAFSVMNTSGKYREDGIYNGTSIGLNGIGAKAINYLSSTMTVTTYRDKKFESIHFIDGNFDNRKEGTTTEKSGVKIEWTPDTQFFDSTKINEKKFVELVKAITSLCKGLVVKINGKEYSSPNGLLDMATAAVKDKGEAIKNRFSFSATNGKGKMEAILTYTNSFSSTIVPYVNLGLTEAGPHITQIKTAITRIANKLFKEKGWLKEKEANLSGDEVQEGMYLIFNLSVPGVAYDAQVKSRITKIGDESRQLIKTFSDELYDWLDRNEKEAKIIADKALKARRAKEAAKKARDNVRKPTNVPKKKTLREKIAISDKFHDCVSKNPKERNLAIVEGNSAAGAVIEARNVKTDAVYAIRGKILSALKTTPEKLLANQEVSNIIDIIGGGFGNDVFDVNKMKVNKVIITTDADPDGDHISLLLMTLFLSYMRPLVEEGRLYKAEVPLYTIKQKGKKNIYFFSEEEFEEWKNENPFGKYEIIRSKGLGETGSKELKESCFENENYTQLTISDLEGAIDLINVLEGKDAASRKEFIYDNAQHFGFTVE